MGFRTKWLEYENVERARGETKWNFWKLFLYSLDGIAAFSTLPLMLASVAGGLFCLLAFVVIDYLTGVMCAIADRSLSSEVGFRGIFRKVLIFVIVRKLIFGDPVSGWPSLVCIILMTSGVQFFCTGILGQYLAKTYLEVKKRPIYLVKEKL